jgi:polysaccharide deacetylase 2 family uncharacterized protein YibQ
LISPFFVTRVRLFATPFVLTIVLFAGCRSKTLTTAERRTITSEIVIAAQRVTGHQSEITVRPEALPSGTGGPARIVGDEIYISLSDTSQKAQLERALAVIGRRQGLSVVETFSGGAIYFDLSFSENRTSPIRVVAAIETRSREAVQNVRSVPRLAIIFDDLGQDRSAADSVVALPFPLTVSILPHLPLSAEVAEEVHKRGDQILLHLPMQSESEDIPFGGARPEEIELRVGMNESQVESTVAAMLATVPYAEGVNNHEGSRATSDPALMQAVMQTLRGRNLFFIDSRTTAATVAYDTAERSGVRAASRKVFLDDIQDRNEILAQLRLAAHDALRDGSAIAIGHPHPATITALAEGVPSLEAQGIRLVFASDIVH